MSSGCRWATAALSLWGRQVGAQRQQGLSPAPHSPPLPSSLLRGPGFLCSDGLTVGWWEALVSEDIGSLAGCIDAPRGRIAELTAFWDQTAKKCGPPPPVWDCPAAGLRLGQPTGPARPLPPPATLWEGLPWPGWVETSL